MKNKKIKVLGIVLITFIGFLTAIKIYTFADSYNIKQNIEIQNNAEIISDTSIHNNDSLYIPNSSESTSENKETNETTENKETLESSEVFEKKEVDITNINEKYIDKKYTFEYTDVLQKVGSLEIPILDLKLPIFKGFLLTEDSMLQGAITNIEGQKMGEGNYVLSSHIMSNPDLLFSSIHLLEVGDIIYTYDNQYQYKYKVYDNFVVTEKDLYITYEIEDYDIITLYTCKYTDNPNIIDRTVVRGVLVDKVKI